MNNEQVLQLVDQLFHEFASSYRNEARQRAVEKLTAYNNARDEICRCGNKKDWEHIRDFVGWRNFNHCPECGGKLSPVA
jgi:hypothetical protein